MVKLYLDLEVLARNVFILNDSFIKFVWYLLFDKVNNCLSTLEAYSPFLLLFKINLVNNLLKKDHKTEKVLGILSLAFCVKA